MKKLSKFAKLRTRLRAAQEEGYQMALTDVETSIEYQMGLELEHRPDVNIHKRTIQETWTTALKLAQNLKSSL